MDDLKELFEMVSEHPFISLFFAWLGLQVVSMVCRAIGRVGSK